MKRILKIEPLGKLVTLTLLNMDHQNHQVSLPIWLVDHYYMRQGMDAILSCNFNARAKSEISSLVHDIEDRIAAAFALTQGSTNDLTEILINIRFALNGILTSAQAKYVEEFASEGLSPLFIEAQHSSSLVDLEDRENYDNNFDSDYEQSELEHAFSQLKPPAAMFTMEGERAQSQSAKAITEVKEMIRLSGPDGPKEKITDIVDRIIPYIRVTPEDGGLGLDTLTTPIPPFTSWDTFTDKGRRIYRFCKDCMVPTNDPGQHMYKIHGEAIDYEEEPQMIVSRFYPIQYEEPKIRLNPKVIPWSETLIRRLIFGYATGFLAANRARGRSDTSKNPGRREPHLCRACGECGLAVLSIIQHFRSVHYDTIYSWLFHCPSTVCEAFRRVDNNWNIVPWMKDEDGKQQDKRDYLVTLLNLTRRVKVVPAVPSSNPFSNREAYIVSLRDYEESMAIGAGTDKCWPQIRARRVGSAPLHQRHVKRKKGRGMTAVKRRQMLEQLNCSRIATDDNEGFTQ